MGIVIFINSYTRVFSKRDTPTSKSSTLDMSNPIQLYGDPNQALFFGGMGIVAALVFGNMGAAYGTAKSGVGICSVAVLKPELIFKSIIPVVMAGILGIYGLIIAVLLTIKSK